jgi:hypothetical protein
MMKDSTGTVEVVGTSESAYSLTKAKRPIFGGVRYLVIIAFLFKKLYTVNLR